MKSVRCTNPYLIAAFLLAGFSYAEKMQAIDYQFKLGEKSDISTVGKYKISIDPNSNAELLRFKASETNQFLTQIQVTQSSFSNCSIDK
jgi:hypothetical protein